MSFEMIERVTQVEKDTLARKAGAETVANEVVAEAKRKSVAVLQKVRDEAAQEGRILMQAAEARAERRTAEIRQEAEKKAGELRVYAAEHLEEAAELIVGRVVKR